MGNRVAVDEVDHEAIPTDPNINIIKRQIDSGNQQGIQDQLERIPLKYFQKYNAEAKTILGQSLLHIAAKYDRTKDCHILKNFLHNQLDISDITECNPTLLHVTIVQENHKAFEMLLGFAKKEGEVRTLLTAGDPPALPYAILQGNYKAIEMLLEFAKKRDKMNTLLTSGNPPALPFAIKEGKYKAVEILLQFAKKRGDMKTLLNSGNPPALPVAIKEENYKAVEMLLQFARKDGETLLDAGNPPALPLAIKEGKYKAVKMLMEFAKKEGETKTLITAGDPQALPVAIMEKNDKAVKMLLEFAKKEGETRTLLTAGKPALSVAIEEKNDKAVKMLLELAKKEGETNALLTAGSQPALPVAIKKKNYKAVEMLLEFAKEEGEANALLTAGSQPALPVAIEKKDDKVVKLLLKFAKKEGQTNALLTAGNQPALHVAIEKKDDKAVENLLEFAKKEGETNALLTAGSQPALSVAIKEKNYKAVEMLLEFAKEEGEANALLTAGSQPALPVAIEKKDDKVFKLLLEFAKKEGQTNALLTAGNQPALHVAIKKKNDKAVANLLEFAKEEGKTNALLTVGNPPALSVAIVEGNDKAVEMVLEFAKKENMTKALLTEGNPPALSFAIVKGNNKAVKILLEFAKNEKETNTLFTAGNPTALFVAIVQGNYQAVKILLESDEKKTLLDCYAKGTQFKNTVLMAQLPLSVAALVLKANDSNSKNIVDQLLEKRVCISKKNIHGDTLFHSLIRYADIYPDKLFDLAFSFKYLWGKYADNASKDPNCKDQCSEHKLTDILFWESEEKLTPLQLSAKLGIGEIFDYIINIQDVYCFQNIRDGLFDIRNYDVTEFDRLIAYIEEQKNPKEKRRKLSILEMLFDSRCNLNEAFQILNQKVVQFILQTKWNAYRNSMILWLILHFLFISVATWTTVEKSNSLVCTGENLDLCDLNENRIGAGVGYLVFGLTYLFIASMTVHKLAVRCYCGGLGLVWHNLDYIICLTVVSLCAILESILSFLQIHWDYHMICLLLCGWYFMLYFSPFHKNLVAFTCMMKAGLLRDFVPFSFIFTFLLVSFTTVMHVLFKGTSEDPEEFHTFRESLLTMFKLGVALDDIGVLNQSRIPWLAYTMFVLFAILSFIHLLNALIAIMSQTFSDVHNEKNSYLKYQRLCMIELFEDIVTPFRVDIVSCIGSLKHWSTQPTELSHPKDNSKMINRYLTTVHSLDDSFYERNDNEEKMKSDVQMNTSQVIDLIRNGNNEVLDFIRSQNKIREDNNVTYIVETYRDQ